MSAHKLRPLSLAWILLCALISPSLSMAAGARSVRRDPLTEKEADLVREAQALDMRTTVFAKAVERRLQVIAGSNAGSGAGSNTHASKQAQKDAEKWGELPQGTRAELLYDIAGILDEAVTNIEDVGSRDSKSSLIPKSLRILSETSARCLSQLAPLRDQVKDDSERDALERVMEGAQEIVTAAGKLPPEAEEPGKPKKQKG